MKEIFDKHEGIIDLIAVDTGAGETYIQGWSLGQRNGRPATWVDLAGIDPRDQTQGI